MSHYFENDQNLKSQLKKTSCSIFNKQFTFYTDNGVFAKKGVDYGSKLLLESIKDEDYSSILDVGCGYGTLGIILNKKYNCYVTCRTTDSYVLLRLTSTEQSSYSAPVILSFTVVPLGRLLPSQSGSSSSYVPRGSTSVYQLFVLHLRAHGT